MVVEGAATAFDRAVRAAERRGLSVVPPWPVAAPRAGTATVVTGVVADETDAAAAVLAVLRGHGAVLHGLADRATLDRLLDDLRRLGPVDHRLPSGGPSLSPEDDELLDLLADGATLEEAAATLHLARRTVDRRLARIRSTLGVATTVEAVVWHKEQG